jgi:hypothetical protein
MEAHEAKYFVPSLYFVFLFSLYLSVPCYHMQCRQFSFEISQTRPRSPEELAQ